MLNGMCCQFQAKAPEGKSQPLGDVWLLVVTLLNLGCESGPYVCRKRVSMLFGVFLFITFTFVSGKALLLRRGLKNVESIGSGKNTWGELALALWIAVI